MIILEYKRKDSIYQKQITDRLYGLEIRRFNGNIPKERYKAEKLLSNVPRKKKKKRGRKKNYLDQFYKIDHFLKRGELTEIKPHYLLRFRHVEILPAFKVKAQGIRKVEYLMLKEYKSFTGFFEYLTMCNDFTYFDALQVKLEGEGITFRNKFLHDIILYELARIQIGIDTYTGFMNTVRFMQPLFLRNLLHDPDYFPDVDTVSHVLRAVPLEALKKYFFKLVDEAFQFKIAKSRILIWDCQFVHSNSSDRYHATEGSYTDEDARFCKHNGKNYGVGYKVSTIYGYCGTRSVPLFCKLFPGNQDEYSVFRDTFEQYFQLGYPKPQIILGDGGPYSIEILRWLFNLEIVPLIKGRKNIKHQNVKKLSDKYYVNMDFVPYNWSKDELLTIMRVRSEIERCFAHNTVVYNARRANVRGIQMVSKHRYLILILDLLKILTAYKIGRPDLIGKCRIFTRTKHVNFEAVFPPLAEEKGYQTFPPRERKMATKFFHP
ncbi:MAG: transposase [Promethearchaeia archaeon]